jgi:hypothetical protein
VTTEIPAGAQEGSTYTIRLPHVLGAIEYDFYISTKRFDPTSGVYAGTVTPPSTELRHKRGKR